MNYLHVQAVRCHASRVASRGRLWTIDDWFRPVAPNGTLSSGRVVTPRDRLGMVGFVAVAALVVAVAFVKFDASRAFAMSGGFMGIAVLQLVNLFRTRHVGFGIRK